MPRKIERERERLEQIEPWTESENKAYRQKDKDFIRNIQLSKNLNKKQAKKEFNTYINSSKKTKKKLALRQSVRDFLKGSSPPTHAKPINAKNLKFTRPKVKKESKPKTPKVQKRLESARKKYPNASTYELHHGVNSKASQEYRLRHGGSRFYEP